MVGTIWGKGLGLLVDVALGIGVEDPDKAVVLDYFIEYPIAAFPPSPVAVKPAFQVGNFGAAQGAGGELVANLTFPFRAQGVVAAQETAGPVPDLNAIGGSSAGID